MPPQNLNPLAPATAAVGTAAKATADALKAVVDVFKLFGDATAAVLAPLKKVTDVMASVATVVTAPLQGLAGAFAGVGAVIGNVLSPVLAPLGNAVSAVADKVGNYLSPVLATAGKSAAAFGGALAATGSAAAGATKGMFAVVGVGEQIAQMVSKANPAVFNKFMMAVEDLTASFGKLLAPLLDVFTTVIRLFADVVTSLAPVGEAIGAVAQVVVEALAPIFQVLAQFAQTVGNVMIALAPALAGIAQSIGAVLAAVAPIFELLVTVLGTVLTAAANAVAAAVKAAVPWIMAFARVIGDVVKWVSSGVRELLALIGITLQEAAPGVKAGASVGAAARTATIGSVEDTLNKARISAYGLGTAAANSPDIQIKNNTAAIADKANQIYNLINDLPHQIAGWITIDLPKAIAELIRNAPKYIKEGATAVGNALEGQGLRRDALDLASVFSMGGSGVAGSLIRDSVGRSLIVNPPIPPKH